MYGSTQLHKTLVTRTDQRTLTGSFPTFPRPWSNGTISRLANSDERFTTRFVHLRSLSTLEALAIGLHSLFILIH